MDLSTFEAEFLTLGNDHETKDVDRFNRALIKRREDVSCLGNIILSKQEYHRTFFRCHSHSYSSPKAIITTDRAGGIL